MPNTRRKSYPTVSSSKKEQTKSPLKGKIGKKEKKNQKEKKTKDNTKARTNKVINEIEDEKLLSIQVKEVLNSIKDLPYESISIEEMKTGVYRPVYEPAIDKFIRSVDRHGGWENDEKMIPKGLLPHRPPVILYKEDEEDEMNNDKQSYIVISGTHRVSAFTRKGYKDYPYCVILKTKISRDVLYQIAMDANEEHEDAWNTTPLQKAISMYSYLLETKGLTEPLTRIPQEVYDKLSIIYKIERASLRSKVATMKIWKMKSLLKIVKINNLSKSDKEIITLQHLREETFSKKEQMSMKLKEFFLDVIFSVYSIFGIPTEEFPSTTLWIERIVNPILCIRLVVCCSFNLSNITIDEEGILMKTTILFYKISDKLYKYLYFCLEDDGIHNFATFLRSSEHYNYESNIINWIMRDQKLKKLLSCIPLLTNDDDKNLSINEKDLQFLNDIKSTSITPTKRRRTSSTLNGEPNSSAEFNDIPRKPKVDVNSECFKLIRLLFKNIMDKQLVQFDLNGEIEKYTQCLKRNQRFSSIVIEDETLLESSHLNSLLDLFCDLLYESGILVIISNSLLHHFKVNNILESICAEKKRKLKYFTNKYYTITNIDNRVITASGVHTPSSINGIIDPVPCLKGLFKNTWIATLYTFSAKPLIVIKDEDNEKKKGAAKQNIFNPLASVSCTQYPYKSLIRHWKQNSRDIDPNQNEYPDDEKSYKFILSLRQQFRPIKFLQNILEFVYSGIIDEQHPQIIQDPYVLIFGSGYGNCIIAAILSNIKAIIFEKEIYTLQAVKGFLQTCLHFVDYLSFDEEFLQHLQDYLRCLSLPDEILSFESENKAEDSPELVDVENKETTEESFSEQATQDLSTML